MRTQLLNDIRTELTRLSASSNVFALTREIPQKDRNPITIHNGVVIENITIKDI